MSQTINVPPVSYTHLDVYKRQSLMSPGYSGIALPPDKAWAKNEEMVDWFAIQFPKMYEAFRLAGGI